MTHLLSSPPSPSTESSDDRDDLNQSKSVLQVAIPPMGQVADQPVSQPVSQSKVHPIRFSDILQKLSKPGQNNSRQPNVLGHCVISALALAAIGMTTHGLNTYAEARQQEWMPEVKTEQVQTLPAESFAGNPLIQDRLNQQLAEVQRRLHRHWSVTSYFYRQYFISISMTASLAVVAGGCGFFVSREGWSRSNNILVNLFIVSSGSALFYGQLPGIFKQDINISANWNLYQNYSSMRDEILTYAATGGTIATATAVDGQPIVITPEQFIYSIDKKLASLNALPIQFDTSQIIKAPDIANTIMGGATGGVSRMAVPSPGDAAATRQATPEMAKPTLKPRSPIAE